MNNRLILTVMTAAVVTTTSGCAPFRNFFFGRGARCGLCTRLSAPLRRQVAPLATAQPTCNQPACVQPQYAPLAAGSGCYSDPCATGYAPSVNYGQTTSAYPSDPYCCPIGNGVQQGMSPYMQPYGSDWQPRAGQDYQSNYLGYPDYGYRIDENGDRIVYEEPLPPGARAVN